MRWVLVVLGLAAGSALAQQASSELWGLIYNLVPPTLSDRQSTVWHGNSSGQLRADGLSPGGCSNSLDFSDGCNSQYLVLFKGGI